MTDQPNSTVEEGIDMVRPGSASASELAISLPAEDASTLVRSRLARVALAAWVNVDPDKLPAEKMWIEHANDANRQAWDRVIDAILTEVAAPDLYAAARGAFVREVGRNLAMSVQRNGWRWPETAPQTVSILAEELRAALAKAAPALDTDVPPSPGMKKEKTS